MGVNSNLSPTRMARETASTKSSMTDFVHTSSSEKSPSFLQGKQMVKWLHGDVEKDQRQSPEMKEDCTTNNSKTAGGNEESMLDKFLLSLKKLEKEHLQPSSAEKQKLLKTQQLIKKGNLVVHNQWAKIMSAAKGEQSDEHFPSKPSSLLLKKTVNFDECLRIAPLSRYFVDSLELIDRSKIMFMYSVDEYKALVTSDPLPHIDVQSQYAYKIIDKFLTFPSNFSLLKCLEVDAHETYPIRLGELLSLEPYSLPTNFFDDCYNCVHESLEKIFETQFRISPRFSEMLHMYNHSLNFLTLEQVLDNQWVCLCYWAFLFQSPYHHYRLSFMMELQHELFQLYPNINQNCSIDEVFKFVNKAFIICQKYLADTALMQFSSVCKNGEQFKAELCRVVVDLYGSFCDEYKEVTLEDYENCTYIHELCERIQMGSIADMKRLDTSAFQTFLESSIYDKYVRPYLSVNKSGTCSRQSIDIIRKLLRECNVSSHMPIKNKLLLNNEEELHDAGNNSIVCNVFSFQAHMDGGFSFRSYFCHEQKGMSHLKVAEPFLIPELNSLADFCSNNLLPPIAFNILIGNGDDLYYGAVYRWVEKIECEKYIQGICILSRHACPNILRSYLAELISLEKKNFSEDDLSFMFEPKQAQSYSSDIRARNSFLLNNNIDMEMLPELDCCFDDVFDCLSIDLVIRLFSYLLCEKKIILVSCSYTILLNSAEVIKNLLFPLVWNHVYVPVLPVSLKEYLHCPTPFIMGVHQSYVRATELPRPSIDVVVVNLDRNSLTGGGTFNANEFTGLRENIQRIVSPRIFNRDQLICPTTHNKVSVDRKMIQMCFAQAMHGLLTKIEKICIRIESQTEALAIVDNSDKQDTLRCSGCISTAFIKNILHSQSVSEFIGSQIVLN